ncbi:MAG TPA: ABC transporter permease [Streptosporangiaceae bacterium]|nr:ABC transporter permease [Streptosporangiaceae bacterium]
MTASLGYGAQSGAGDRRPPVRQVAADIWARSRSADVRPAAAWVLTLILLFIYAGLQPGTLSTSSLGILAADTLALATLGLGQGVVILTAGIDLSVGGVLALGTTIAATHFTGTGTTLLWSVVILAIGTAAGLINGVLVGRLRLQPFIVTLATWSIFDGIALYVLPTAGGQVPGGFSGWINGSAAGIPNSIWALIALVAVWLWFRRTRAARRIYAVGSDREAARIAGVRIVPTLVTAYAISGLCAGGAALFYTMLTASGDPTSGDGLILPSVAAVVIGGASLFGGQGSFVGTVAGALTLTLLGDVIFAVHLPSYWTVLADGLLLIAAVLAGTGLQALQARRAGGGA